MGSYHLVGRRSAKGAAARRKPTAPPATDSAASAGSGGPVTNGGRPDPLTEVDRRDATARRRPAAWPHRDEGRLRSGRSLSSFPIGMPVGNPWVGRRQERASTNRCSATCAISTSVFMSAWFESYASGASVAPLCAISCRAVRIRFRVTAPGSVERLRCAMRSDAGAPDRRCRDGSRR